MNTLRTLLVAMTILSQGYSQTAKEDAEAAHNGWVEMYIDWARSDPGMYRNMLGAWLADFGTNNVELPTPLKDVLLLSSRMLQEFVTRTGTNIVEEDLRKDLRLLSKLQMRVMFWPTAESSLDGTNYWAEVRKSLFSRGFTNVTEEDLRDDPMLAFAAGFRVHSSLPRSCLQWPPPDTNRMDGVTEFITRHGWNMGQPQPTGLIFGPGTKFLTGLPWPVIADQTFKAYTVNNWLVVLIDPPTSFGWSHGGLLWSAQTNPPPTEVFSWKYEWKALGAGWYGFRYQN
jgi:hypothetical protein